MVYLDNAATTFPKPPKVIEAVKDCITEWCANAGRSSHSLGIKTDEAIYSVREKVANFLHFDKPENIVFTTNATYALNIAIKTIVPPGSHIIISDLEHNSVLRPIEKLCKSNKCSYSVFSSDGNIEENIEGLIQNNTSAIVSTIVSNVTGKEISIDKLCRISKNTGLKLIVDASQALGHIDVDISRHLCDAICAPAHKGLFGIQGTGFVCFGKDTPEETLVEGGSGNQSLLPFMPKALPEHFEAGTLPTPSIVGLGAGIDFINELGISTINKKILYLTSLTASLLEELDYIEVFGKENGIFSFRSKKNIDLPGRLTDADICVRSGLHCSPLAHKKLGTTDTGLTRVSLSYFNNEEDIHALIKSIKV